MFRRDNRDFPEKRSSSSLPIWVILFAICAILVYLAIGGTITGEDAQSAVFLPDVVG